MCTIPLLYSFENVTFEPRVNHFVITFIIGIYESMRNCQGKTETLKAPWYRGYAVQRGITWEVVKRGWICRSADSNRDGISPTAPSRQRVYQFHHFGVTSISRRKDRREMVDGSGRGPLVRWSGGQSRFRVGQSLGGRRLLVSQGFFLDNAACALRIVGQQVQTDDDQHV